MEESSVIERLLTRKQEELKEVKKVLVRTQCDLAKCERKAEVAAEGFRKAKQLNDTSERIIKGLLRKWLSKDSMLKVENIIRHYHPEDPIQLLGAMLEYIVTGKKTRFDRYVATWHFAIFCELADEDAFSEQTHSYLARLWKKVGPFEKIDN
jgi:Fe-S cluster biosynthesis and repair protein YggX